MMYKIIKVEKTIISLFKVLVQTQSSEILNENESKNFFFGGF